VTRSTPILIAALATAAAAGERFRFDAELSAERTAPFEALVDRPDPARANGHAVLLIGGGLAWDHSWTVPGTIEHEGAVTRLTIDGESTRDADTIVAALLDAGFVALRFSTANADDPKPIPDPMPFPDTVALTRAAWRAFGERGLLPQGRVFLLGHSLGAARAALIADESAAGFVLLSGAYLSKTAARPSVLAREAEARHQGETGGEDFDDDGVLRGWEWAALDRARGAIAIEGEGDTWRDGLPWPSDRLRALDLPLLALYGGLDDNSLHAVWLEAEARADRLGDADIRFFPHLGHQLSPDRKGLIAPIDPRVVDAIVEWLTARAQPRSVAPKEQAEAP
jgi:hypothetical protein